MNRTRPIKLAIAALGCLMLAGLSAAPAQAELVGEFNARLKNIKLDYGGYTAVFDSRVYDTTGAPPPMLQSAQIQFPRGASIRPEFLRGGFFCDTAKLEQSSDPASCASSRFASGDILLDARPSITTAIPSSIFLFLSRPREAGATATVAVLVVSNEKTPVYSSQVLYGSLFPDQGSFGYRLVLPTTIKPLVPGLQLSLAELSLTVKGLTLTKKGKRSRQRQARSLAQGLLDQGAALLGEEEGDLRRRLPLRGRQRDPPAAHDQVLPLHRAAVRERQRQDPGQLALPMLFEVVVGRRFQMRARTSGQSDDRHRARRP